MFCSSLSWSDLRVLPSSPSSSDEFSLSNSWLATSPLCSSFSELASSDDIFSISFESPDTAFLKSMDELPLSYSWLSLFSFAPSSDPFLVFSSSVCESSPSLSWSPSVLLLPTSDFIPPSWVTSFEVLLTKLTGVPIWGFSPSGLVEEFSNNLQERFSFSLPSLSTDLVSSSLNIMLELSLLLESSDKSFLL